MSAVADNEAVSRGELVPNLLLSSAKRRLLQRRETEGQRALTTTQAFCSMRLKYLSIAQ